MGQMDDEFYAGVNDAKLNKAPAERNGRIIVRNISFKATKEALKEHFTKFGNIQEVNLLKKPDGKLVGCGFVHFADVDAAEKAIAATNKKPFMERPIFVAWAVPKKSYVQNMDGNETKPKFNNSFNQKFNNNSSSQLEPKEEEGEEVSEKKEDKKKERVNRNARLVIRNVSFKATEESLKEHFEPYGEILETKLLKKPDGKLVGCAFIHFKNVPMAKKALLNTNMKPFLGRPISVDWAVAKNKYMQHVVSQQLEMEENIKKEESDSDDDEKPPLNVTSDDVKDEIKSESDSDEESDDESGSDSEDEKKVKKPVKSESDDDDDESEDDDDDGEEEEDDDEQDEEEDEDIKEESFEDVKPERQRIKLNDAEDGCTVFITNIPFSVDNDQLREFAQHVGPVNYALVCVDKMTEHSKGSGFVKFTSKEHADAFLALPAEQLRLEGQLLQVKPALKRENLQKAAKHEAKDNRNLYLVKEGVVVAGTKAAVGVSASDMAKRLALERSKTQMLKNLNRFVSRYRLVVSNLPAHLDDAKLRRVCVTAGDKRAVVTECRVMRDLRTPTGADGKHPPRREGGSGQVTGGSRCSSPVRFRNQLEEDAAFDCQAFQLTLDKKDMATSPKVARWIMMLQEYNFTIEHRTGSQMRHADALSRYPYVAVITSELHQKLKDNQAKDITLKAIIEILKDKPYDDYWLDNGILYKGPENRLVVPKNMEVELIRCAHDNGHFGKKKTIELLIRDYYINNLDRKVEQYIQACIPCLLASRKAGKQEGLLCPIEKGEVPLDTLHLDHIGPMTETNKQYNHILTVVDAFTKFTWIFPTKSTTSREVIAKLQIHQQVFGNPRRIITDRGTAFTSGEFRTYCEDEKIEHVTITTGIPRGNGQVERIHRVIISVLTKLCIEQPGNWYKHVSRLQQALNSTYQRSVNAAPFELLLGTKMRLQSDPEILSLIQQENRDMYINNREELRKKAKEQILKVQEENRQNFNKGRKKSQVYQVGDLVAIRRTQFGVGMKLRPKYLGPYSVTKVKRDRYDVVKVGSTSEGPNRTSTAPDSMKPWPGVGDDDALSVSSAD